MNPLFSVLIANYNNGRYIATCLDSILQQTYSPIEIILVDDASTDDSLAIIAPYLAKHANIKLHQQAQNASVGATKKHCIDLATGDICGFVDPDDTIVPNAIELMVNAHLAQSHVGLIYSDYYECDAELNITATVKVQQVQNGDVRFFNADGQIGPLATFKKSAYQLAQPLDPYLKRAIDQDMYLKMYDVAAVKHLPELLYHYRMHKDGIATFENSDKSVFWSWIVRYQIAKSRGLNIEEDFTHTFVRKARVKYLLAIDTWLRNSIFYRLLKR